MNNPSNTPSVLRNELLNQIHHLFKVTPIVALLGPRQCGKTTLARQYISESEFASSRENYFDLENPSHLARLSEPQMVLESLHHLIVIDEVQRIPNLFPLLRVLVDTPALNQRYLILGSASRDLLQQTSETLAGRISYLEIPPFSLTEVNDQEKLWIRGGFPRSYLAENDSISYDWRIQYIQTFLERDILNMGIKLNPQTLRRFWMMLSHYHGKILNQTELGNALGITHKTVRSYCDILTGSLMVRSLSPWFENIGKRQVKSPKIYIRDSGILHTLLGTPDQSALWMHPGIGHSWEGFALEEVIRHHRAREEECFFWATHSHAELDLMILKNNKRLGFEFKFTKSPRFTSSMKIAMETLGLDALTVIYAGDIRYPIADKIWAEGLSDYIHTD